LNIFENFALEVAELALEVAALNFYQNFSFGSGGGGIYFLSKF
jgi:hypothetical protein